MAEPTAPELSDIFTTIAARALEAHGVTDPDWIRAIAAEHRTAFADLGLTIPPGGIGILEPEPETAAAPAPRSAAAAEAPLTLTARALMLLAMLEQEPETATLWVQDVQPYAAHTGALQTAMLLRQAGVVVGWRRCRDKAFRKGPPTVEFSRIVELWFPADVTNPLYSPVQKVSATWLHLFRPTRAVFEEPLQTWLDSIRKPNTLSTREEAEVGKWWPLIEKVRMP